MLPARSIAAAHADVVTAQVTTAVCPNGLPTAARCLTGTDPDAESAHCWIAVPAAWDGLLVLHAHGGIEPGAPHAERSVPDLKRWALMLKAGRARAGSTFRQGGVAVRSAAEDTERLRGPFTELVARPRVTRLHGQSWGASVAAVAAETRPHSFGAVLLTGGVLGGGARSCDFRLGLCVNYQALCNKHPPPEEVAYPLWQDRPPGGALTRAELARRVDDCTGLRLGAAQRGAARCSSERSTRCSR